MAFVDIKPTVHLVRLAAGETPFSAAVPAQHPGRLNALEIDEAFEIGSKQLPSRQAFCKVVLRDTRAEYETRPLQTGDFLVVQDTEDGGAATVRFRGRIRKPRIQDREHGRIEIAIEGHGLWTRITQASDVSVPPITGANGKQAVDSVLDQIPWPTSFRNIPSPPGGANAIYSEWAFDGPAALGIDNALAGLNPRSKFYVDATGTARVVWLSGNIVQFRASEVRPSLSRDDTELHVLNQIVAPALEITRTTTTRYTSSAALDLDDDMDTVVFEGTLEGGSEDATFALDLRQDNGTYFPHHSEVNESITAVHIRGTTMFSVVATARARDGTYTTVDNFFHIDSTIRTEGASGDDPLVRSLRGITPDEPKQRILPTLAYPSGHSETLAANYLTLWGRPLQVAAFEIVASNDAVLDRVRGLSLWQRISLFDGADTHFGFVARKKWVYGPTYSWVEIVMLEDFTEGGDISIPFRDPFEWVLNSIAALDMFFDRASALTNQGAWEDDSGGSTPTSNTGPTANNVLAFVHTETSGGNRTDHEDNGVITVLDDPFAAIRNRDVIFRYAAYGDFAAGDGLVVQGRTVQSTILEDALLIGQNTNAIVRANLSDLSDIAPPYGGLGDVNYQSSIMAAALDANGDLIAIHIFNNIASLVRINLADADDATGDYGTIGTLGNIGRPLGGTLDANGDFICVTTVRRLYRFNVADPTIQTGIYGQLGAIDTLATFGSGGIAIDTNGDLLVMIADGRLLRMEIPDTMSMTQNITPTTVGEAYSGLGQVRGMDIDNSGDLIVYTFDGVGRVNVSDPTDETGDYGFIADPAVNPSDRGALVLEPRTVTNFGAWADISTLPASTYPAGNLDEGDTDTDVEGDDYTIVADGGWRDVTVSIPNTYQQIRLRPELNTGGTESGQDIALRSIRSAGTGQPQLTRPTGLSLTEAGGDITADWNDVADATGYVLEWREEGSGDAWQDVDVTTPPHTFTP